MDAADLLRRWLHGGEPVIGDRVALSTRAGGGWSELTYRDLDDRSSDMAAALTAAGVRPGDRVALLGEPGGDWAIGFFGVLRAGAVAVLLDAKLTDEELAPLCRRSELAAAVVSAAVADRWPDHSIPVLDASGPTGTDASGGSPTPRAMDDPAVVVWTSGTTGEPKGVMLSLANLAYVVEQSSAVQRTGPDARWLSVLPPNHLLELCCGLLPGVAAGSTTFVARTILPAELWSMIADCRVSQMVVVPMVLRLLRRHLEHLEASAELTPGPLRAIYCGGAPLDADTVAYFDRLGIGVFQGYGLTEAAPVVSMNSPGDNRPGSVGRPLPGTAIRIGAKGEILVKGPGIMLGYWHDAEATREAVDDHGWLHTGDLGHLDDSGYLFVTGRAKSLIVLDSGKKVQPEEVEAALSTSELFAEVCVVGWGRPGVDGNGSRGAALGEQVCAVVVPAREAMSRALTQQEAEEEVRRLSAPLSGFKRPTLVRLHDGPLPRTVKRTLRRSEVLRYLERTGR